MAYRKIRTRIPLPAPRVLVGCALLFVGVVAAWVWHSDTEPERHPSAEIALVSTSARIAAPAAARPAKVVYRNSVLPGGVGSAVELRSALAHDPVAAAHYAGFNVGAARKVQVERSRMAHVSYRIGDKIYWTKKPVRLAQGETLLSDGEHLVRGRCGNRIADEAQAPVLVNEPAPEVLEMAYISAEPLIDAPSDAPPRANVDAASQVADAQPATRTRILPSFAFFLDPGLISPPAIYAPTRTLAFVSPPDSASGGGSVTVGAPLPPSTAKPETSTPDTPTAPPPELPAPDSPPPKSPPLDLSPPPVTPPPAPKPPVNLPRPPTPIPEPGSAALIGLGLGMVWLMRRTGTRRRTR